MGPFISDSRSQLHYIFISILLLLFVVGCGSTEIEKVVVSQNQSEYKYELTLSIAKDTTQESIENVINGKIIRWLPEAGIAIIATNEEITTDTFAQQGDLLDLFVVLSVEAGDNRVIAPVAQNGASAWSQGASAWSQGVIGGHFAANTNAFEQINLFETHKKSQAFGEGVIVAVIDTGFDLSHSIFIDHLSDSSSWKDFIDNDNLPDETASPDQAGYGHGTAVAGLVIQSAPRVQIMPIRAIDNNGLGDTDVIAEAIEWAVANGANIINLSLGSEQVSGAIEAMLLYAHNQGVYTVASAGNTGDSNVLFPASIANTVEIDIANEQSWQDVTAGWENATSVIGVGSVDSNEKLSTFSSHGTSLDVFAPGEGLITSFSGNQLASVTGTSFATPLVSGSIALTIGEPTNAIAPNAVLDVLNSTSKGITAKNIDFEPSFLGNGIVNTYNFSATGNDWPNITYQVSFNDGDAGSFVYSDDSFTTNGHDYYANGWVEDDSRCYTQDRCLIVLLGGKDANDIGNMSGGWNHNFTLEETANVHVNFFTRTSLTKDLEADEFVEGNISINGQRVYVDNNPYFQRLHGSSDKTHPLNSGWKEINLSLGVLEPGNHTVTIGAFQNKKTYSNEYTSIRIDDFHIHSESATTTENPENTNTIFNLVTGFNKCLDVFQHSIQDDGNIQQWTCWDTAAQQFEQIPVDGGFLLKNVHSGKCIEVSGENTSNEANIQQYRCKGPNENPDNQIFNWSGYSLVAKHSNKCIDVSHGSSDNGTNIWQYKCNGTTAQRFSMSPITTTPVNNSTSSAFEGSPATIPGIIEAENFDTGPENVAYFDLDSGNNGAPDTPCRIDSDVDTRLNNDGNSCRLTWVQAGEWLNYTVNISQTGTYEVIASVSAAYEGGTFEILINETSIATGQIPNTGGWEIFQDVSLGNISLNQGTNTLKLNLLTNSPNGHNYVGAFDYLEFILQ